MNFTERQQQIINKAIEIIAQKGYQELTIKHLAAAVGVSEAALYRYFSSKNELIHQILAYFEALAQQIMGSITENIQDPLEQVKAFVMNRYELFTANPDLAKVMFSEEIFWNDPSLGAHNLDIMHKHSEQIIKSIRAAQRKKEIRNDLSAVQLFRIIIGSLRLLITQWQLSDYSFSLTEEGKKLWQTLEKLIKEI
ncbi:MAG: TetR/AcrR family transcriptional regulator [Candidatus Cloacimonadaceae bacterium]